MMNTVIATAMLNANGTPACCPLCGGQRVIVTEQMGESISPLLPMELVYNNLGRASTTPAQGRNVETTFLHKPTCEARVKAFR